MKRRRRSARRVRAAAASMLFGSLLGGCYVGVGLSDDRPLDREPLDEDDEEPTDEPLPDEPEELSCEGRAAAGGPLRRLSRAVYLNSIRDLFGVDARDLVSLEDDEVIAGYRNNLIDPVTEAGVDKYLDAAETLSAELVDLGAVAMPCEPADPDCITEIVDTLGRRMYRRPLLPAERERLLELHASAPQPEDGVRLVLQAMLQSPWFLYLVEQGDLDRAEEHRVPLTSPELAARLAHLLWQSAPDDALLDAAELDDLVDPEQLRAQAERMLDDPRAQTVIFEFHRQWLSLPEYSLEAISKDPEAFPEFDEPLREAMIRELELLPDLVIRHGDGRLASLMRPGLTIVDEGLAALYGIDPVADALPEPDGLELPAGYSVVEQPSDERAGVLGLAGIWATLGKPSDTNVPLRGQFVAQQLLCINVPPPPPDVDSELPPADPDATAREKFEQETSAAGCQGCHGILNPLGFAMESYDGLGRHRVTDEFGHPIDASVEVELPAVEGWFDGPVELAEGLAESEALGDCVAEHWFRFGFGATPYESDAAACGFEEVRARFEESGHDIRELLIAIATSEAFRYRPR